MTVTHSDTPDRPPLDLDAIRAPEPDLFVADMRECAAKVVAHEHPARGEDLYCLNLVAYMGERMGGVLRRLDESREEVASLKARNTALADEMLAEVTALRAELDAYKRPGIPTYEQLLKSHADLLDERDEASAIIAEQAREIAARDDPAREVQLVRQELAFAREATKSATDEVLRLADALKAVRAELDAARAGVDELQKQWGDACEEVEELSRDLAAARAELRTNEDSEDARLAIAEAEVARLRATPDLAAIGMADILLNDGSHLYWSTHCRHGNHEACSATEFAPGVPRSPGQCKTCAVGCTCECHSNGVITATDDGSDVGAAFDPREPLMSRAARAESTPTEAEFQAAMEQNREQWHAVGLGAEFDAAHAERTEPATGEDVARMFHETYEHLAPEYGYRTREASAKPWDEVPEQNRALMVATVTEVLAALDLPGRERALREESQKTARTLIEMQNVAVEDWKRHADRLTAERDAAQHRAYVAEDKLALAEIHLAEAQADRDGTARSLAAVQEGQQRIANDWDRMRVERDAANAALADVARLLDEARVAYEEIAGAMRMQAEDGEEPRLVVDRWWRAAGCRGQSESESESEPDRIGDAL